MTNMKEIRILLVEDSEGDVILVKKAMEKARLRNELAVVDDGEKALKYLRNEPPYEQALAPDLILLDINLPRLNGKEVLEAIKSDPLLKVIPVVILTTSDSERDIFESYQKHANCYITKPVNFENFISVVHTIEEFWISVVTLPKVKPQP